MSNGIFAIDGTLGRTIRAAIHWYRDFYDVPRFICVRVRDGYIVLDASFDETLDAHRDTYAVTRIVSDPVDTFDAVPGTRLGDVAVADVAFDETRRLSIDLPSMIGPYAIELP